MAERGGFGSGFGRSRTGKRGGGRGRGGADDDLKNWVPVTKLGRLVHAGLISSIEEIYLHSIPIKEYQIVDYFFSPERSQHKLVDDVVKIVPVQKQTNAGQRTRFKAFVAVGDYNGHCGLGTKCAKEVATAIRGAIIAAKISLIPVRRGYWGNMIGEPHTVPMKVHGKCGSVRVRLVPAPRGTQIVGAPTTKKLLAFAGIKDCFSASSGSTKTRGNFLKAIFNALSCTYGYLTPDLWTKVALQQSVYEEYSSFLASAKAYAK
ncbi:40S ribosomal protein S2, putative [Theileria equi strain WA]|uniref:Small ribosomal subunit protein uS5 n=1 Tax=Theileria equi strain WA TaxID=1537102 RepID=L0AXV8_THEEQ|nr:40S ribosomal protein S2, putative [Theileria equi strain WA]AFZ79856.1 40S ribosomal protein S2, putative [Theileria equi strain WA]|eukprot:XP_004829522.1 40S ribosomal protein S2, putative [Theileria equi strain WA]